MDIVYQLTFFLALGLLAIVITIFVFAVSQIGRATESVSKEQQDILNNQKDAEIKQIEKIEEQLAEAKRVGQLNESKLKEEIQKSMEEIGNYNKQLNRIQERVELIRRKGAVIYPGIALIIVIALNITASGLFEAKTPLSAALWLWIISIPALLYGIYRVYRTLGAIEQVTVTSQEAIEKLPKAVKLALLEIEEEKRPGLKLWFIDEQPPFQIVAGEEKKIMFSLGLNYGSIARKPCLVFFAPIGFTFPDKPTQIQPKEYPIIGGNISCSKDYEDCIGASRRIDEVRIQAPIHPGIYQIKYRLLCEGFDSQYEEFDVVVKEKLPSSK